MTDALTGFDLEDALLFLFSIVFVVHWVAYIFGLGRYARAPAPKDESDFGFLMSKLSAKVITNFRHLLALLIVLIFALAVLYTMLFPDDFEENLQAVVAALGGIVGSVLGYYFGETKAQQMETADNATDAPGELDAAPPEGEDVQRPAPRVPQGARSGEPDAGASPGR